MKQRISREDRDRVIELRNLGYSCGETAAAVGVSNKQVSSAYSNYKARIRKIHEAKTKFDDVEIKQPDLFTPPEPTQNKATIGSLVKQLKAVCAAQNVSVDITIKY